MNKSKIKEIITTKTDIEYALSWHHDQEKILNFEWGFNSNHLGLSMSEDQDLWEYALNLFERTCAEILGL